MTLANGQLVRAATLAQTPRADAAVVASAQYDAMLALLRDLRDADWGRPTDCAGWTVRDIAAHVTGAADEGAHLRVSLRHLRAARRGGGPSVVDAMNAAQIADRERLPPGRIVDELARLAPRAVRARRRTPALVRRRAVPGDDLPAGSMFGYLFDVIFSRDVWMHRIDIARACERPPTAIQGDDEVVAQVMRDLDRSWSGPAVALRLTGPAGGAWLIGDGAQAAEAQTDAVEYLRLLSGRAASPQINVTGDPAVREALLEARVAF